MQRTGRREGIYAREIAGVNLSVASFALGLENLNSKDRAPFNWIGIRQRAIPSTCGPYR